MREVVLVLYLFQHCGVSHFLCLVQAERAHNSEINIMNYVHILSHPPTTNKQNNYLFIKMIIFSSPNGSRLAKLNILRGPRIN